MPSAKKRTRSPEVDRPSSTRRKKTTNHFQSPRFPKTRYRGPKDDPIRAFEKAERGRRGAVFWDTRPPRPTTNAHQLNTRAHRTAPAPVDSPLQRSPEPAVPHSPPSLPAGGDEYGPEFFNDSSVSSHIPIGSGLRTTSRPQDNRILFRQTRRLDNHTSAWKRRRDNQAVQWRTVAIPRLVPTYLANRAATESGRLPPPKPNYQCQCERIALKVETVTWDHKFSFICGDCLLIVFYIRILAADIVYLQVLSSCSTVGRNGLLPFCPDPPNARLRYQPPRVCDDRIASHGTQRNRVVKHTSIFPVHPRVYVRGAGACLRYQGLVRH